MNFSTFQLKQLFRPAYLFNPYPGTDFNFYWFFIAFYGLLLILAIAGSIWATRVKKDNPIKIGIKKVTDLFYTIGILGYILLGLRFENVAYLSMRFVFIVYIVSMLIWGVFVALFLIRKLPKKMANYKEKLRKAKYLE